MSLMNEHEYAAALKGLGEGQSHVIRKPLASMGKIDFSISWCDLKVNSTMWLFQSAEHAKRSVEIGTFAYPCDRCWKAIEADNE